MSLIKEGYLYIAFGQKYINEATVSATSLRKVDKVAHITLITNEKIKNKLFDNVIIKEMEYNNPKIHKPK